MWHQEDSAMHANNHASSIICTQMLTQACMWHQEDSAMHTNNHATQMLTQEGMWHQEDSAMHAMNWRYNYSPLGFLSYFVYSKSLYSIV
jgi:predicted secreted acid phosphatase